MNELMDERTRAPFLAKLRDETQAAQARLQADVAVQEPEPPPAAPSPLRPRGDVDRRPPPDLKRHELRDQEFAAVQPWLNEQVLFGRHLGLRGLVSRLFEQKDVKAEKLREAVHGVIDRHAQRLLVNAAWRFWPAVAQGDAVVLLERPGGDAAARFDFPRQRGGERLCLSDFVASEDPRDPDYVALFVTTCGRGVREAARALMDSGDYLEAHALQAAAIEGAEAAAEWVHATLRRAWGFGDPPGTPMQDVFKARYRGLRVSFGYPACPNLEDQATLFDLLEPATIGVTLTEGFMMEPEASVSALVFQHPDARYFSA
jgi:5-methyltetrahydrofolate--homocysteine methyltransferase